MSEIYFIGGSPCSGKSTIAERLTEKYKFQYFRFDDFLEEYISRGVEEGHKLFEKVASSSMEEMWMRSPSELCAEEIALYEIMFSYAMDDLLKLSPEKPIIAEGAGFMPSLMSKLNVDENHYICIVPTREFQMEKYEERDWISDYLSDCSDEKKAFENWMERDVLFGKVMLQEAEQLGYPTLIVDGRKSIEENVEIVEELGAKLLHWSE
jgi:2-phosphoglycerate kinase